LPASRSSRKTRLHHQTGRSINDAGAAAAMRGFDAAADLAMAWIDRLD